MHKCNLLSFAVSLTSSCSHTLCFPGDVSHMASSLSTSPLAIFSFRCPKTWPFPIHSLASNAHLNTPSLCLEIQLVRGALICWEETWAWRGTWHTPAAPQGCSSREPLPPHKGPWAGYISHMLLSVAASRYKQSVCSTLFSWW